MRGDEPEHLLGDLHRAIRPVRRPNPFVLIYRWRYEVGASAAALFVLPVLVDLPPPGVIAALGGVAVVLAVPDLRLLLWMRLRVIWIQHRVRTAFVRRRVHANDGRIPVLLWTTPRRHADRLLLALPAGLTPGLLASEADAIAVACEGEYAEVLPVRGFRSVVRLVIVRH